LTGEEAANVSSDVEPVVRHSVLSAIVHVLLASGSSSPQDVRHGARRRIFAAGEHVTLGDLVLSFAMLVGAAAGCDSLWDSYATDLVVASLAAVDPSAGVVTG